MFELVEDGTLRHRQDVRQLMLRTMVADPTMAARVADIHQRAARCYSARSGAVAKAEELYHRLMSGENPRELEELWRTARSAARPPRWTSRCRNEPRSGWSGGWAWLRRPTATSGSRRIGRLTPQRGASWLASGAAREALTVLNERRTRLKPVARVRGRRSHRSRRAGPRRTGTGRGNAAGRTTDLSAQLDLAEQAVELRIRQDDITAVVEAARRSPSPTSLESGSAVWRS